jgi:hypothetical protein
VNWQKDTYRLQVIRGMFLMAGALLLFTRLSPTYYVNTNFSVFQNAGHNVDWGAAGGSTRATMVAPGGHHESPMSTPDKRFDFDGYCVIVSSNWSLVPNVPGIAEHFATLPEKLSFAHLTTLSLRGPPRLLS